jgi:hypothetical protein
VQWIEEGEKPTKYFCGLESKIFTSLVLIRGVTNTRITQLYSGFGPCRFWVLKGWRMPKAHDNLMFKMSGKNKIVRIQKFLLKRGISRRLKRGIPEQG